MVLFEYYWSEQNVQSVDVHLFFLLLEVILSISRVPSCLHIFSSILFSLFVSCTLNYLPLGIQRMVIDLKTHILTENRSLELKVLDLVSILIQFL